MQQPTTYDLLWKCHGHSISFVKMLRHLVVFTIFSKLLGCQFFTSQNKILQNYKGIMKILCHYVVFLEIFCWFSQLYWAKICCFAFNFLGLTFCIIFFFFIHHFKTLFIPTLTLKSSNFSLNILENRKNVILLFS